MAGIVSYSQNLEDVILWRALHEVKDGFYIDVGANDPTFDSVTLAFYERGWRGINIEPIPAHYNALQSQRPRDTNLNCAAGAAPGELEFWEFDVHGWSTGNAEVAARHQAEGRSAIHRKVPLRTLADICAQYAPADIHFLKIDVEGFEKDVLRGADFARFRPWVLVIEATEPNSTVQSHAEWESLVTTRGYEYVYTDGLNRFYLAKEHARLKPRFAYPPNVFDGYQRHAEALYMGAMNRWKAQAEQLQRQLQETAAQHSEALARHEGAARAKRRVFIDTSGHSAEHFFGGTSRVIFEFISRWLDQDDASYEIVLVRCPRAGDDYERDDDFERVFRRSGVLAGRPLPTPAAGDVFLLAASHVFFTNSRHGYFDALMARGVKVCALVLDFIALFHEDKVPPDWVREAHVYGNLLFRLDGVFCISRKVAEEFETLVRANGVQLKPAFKLAWSHLGADFHTPGGRPTPAESEALAKITPGDNFLVVGSIEPRKGYRQALAAFEALWAQGSEARLVILGKHLWLMDDFPAVLASHPEAGRRLFWFNGGSDALLEELFRRASFLLMPSEDEGFGLPVAEAARRGLPLLLRDNAVFREIAGPHASYFSGNEPEALAKAVGEALAAKAAGTLPESARIRTLTWAESARNFWRMVPLVGERD